eukprot:1154367-Pelagomonas_calceolata.AAC.8
MRNMLTLKEKRTRGPEGNLALLGSIAMLLSPLPGKDLKNGIRVGVKPAEAESQQGSVKLNSGFLSQDLNLNLNLNLSQDLHFPQK